MKYTKEEIATGYSLVFLLQSRLTPNDVLYQTIEDARTALTKMVNDINAGKKMAILHGLDTTVFIEDIRGLYVQKTSDYLRQQFKNAVEDGRGPVANHFKRVIDEYLDGVTDTEDE